MADNDEFDTLEFNALNTSLPPPYSPPPSYLLPIQPAMVCDLFSRSIYKVITQGIMVRVKAPPEPQVTET